ncbi:MAG: hypothetical protein ABJ360_01895 [Roseobacter sp.]
MNFKHVILFSAACVSGCATVSSQSSRDIIVDGQSYELRTSVIEGSKGPFERSQVKVNNKMYICLPDSKGDCEAAVRQGRDESNRRG